VGDITLKTAESDRWANMTREDALALITARRHLLITGGEPCIQDLYALTQLLDQ